MSTIQNVVISKLNLQGNTMIQYEGLVLERGSHHIIIEARYTHENIDIAGLILRKLDRFVETYYSDRYYNVFEIYDHTDERFKGWYCNIGRPAIIQQSSISYVDLALDLVVFPDKSQLVLDEEEFVDLPLLPEERAQALAALEELQARFWEEK